jgi:hypothetical protein
MRNWRETKGEGWRWGRRTADTAIVFGLEVLANFGKAVIIVAVDKRVGGCGSDEECEEGDAR